MDKKIRIKVTEELAIGRTIDNYVSAGAESKEFDIVFPNPVAYTPINASLGIWLTKLLQQHGITVLICQSIVSLSCMIHTEVKLPMG